MKMRTSKINVSPRFSLRLMPILAAAALIAWCPLPARAANLIVNPGFETGNFTGWTFNPGPTSGSGVDNSNPHSGTYAAVLDDTTGPPPIEELSQTVATTSGTFYDVSFWLSNSASGGSRSFIASFAGTTIALGGSPAFPYTEFAFSVQATGGSSVMDFRDFNNGGAWYLDDVSVTPARSVPDAASTWTLLLLGVSATFGLNLLLGKPTTTA
jgi:Carbohydrate binding domain